MIGGITVGFERAVGTEHRKMREPFRAFYDKRSIAGFDKPTNLFDRQSQIIENKKKQYLLKKKKKVG